MGRLPNKKSTAAKKKTKKREIESVNTKGETPVSSAPEVKQDAQKKTGSAFGFKKNRSADSTRTSKISDKNNLLNRWSNFFKDVKAELKKVTWPSRKQTISSTVVVIVLVMIISAFLGMVDFGLSSLIRLVIQ